MAKQLLLVLPGVLSEADKKKLERSMIVIETPSFDAFRAVNAETLIANDQFAIALLETLGDYTYHEKFAARILKAMKKNGGLNDGEPK